MNTEFKNTAINIGLAIWWLKCFYEIPHVRDARFNSSNSNEHSTTRPSRKLYVGQILLNGND